MRISHEAIYQSLYVQGRGALRRELTACLRTGRALRVPRARAQRGKSFVTDEILISERPAEAEDRAVPGHWEGDLILGLDRSAIGTLVERSSRFTMLLHLPPPADRTTPAAKHGPPVSGHGAEAVRDAIAEQITTLPEQLRRSLTWDQGAEMAEHAQLRIETGLQVYFCDPQSPWQRGSNENTNGLLRQYFPRAQTSPATAPTTSLRSPRHSTAGRARRSDGERRPRSWTSTWRPRHERTPGPDGAHAAIAAPALAPLTPPRRQPRFDPRSPECPYSGITHTLLRGPVESGQYVSLAFGRAAGDAGIAVSMGSRGDAYDTQSRLIGPAAAGSV